MATFFVTWDGTDDGYDPGEYALDVADTTLGQSVESYRSVGSRRQGISPNDRIFLLRQRNRRGLIAAGRALDGRIHEEAHWGDPTRMAYYTSIRWDTVLPIDLRLPTEDLQRLVPRHDWAHMLGSGQKLKEVLEPDLEAAWTKHVAGVRTPQASA